MDEYQKKLLTVEKLLASNPSDETLLSVKQDLLKAIEIAKHSKLEEIDTNSIKEKEERNDYQDNYATKSSSIRLNVDINEISNISSSNEVNKLNDGRNELEMNSEKLSKLSKELINLDEDVEERKRRKRMKILKKSKSGYDSSIISTFYIGGRCLVERIDSEGKRIGKFVPCVIDSIGTDINRQEKYFDVRKVIDDTSERIFESDKRMKVLKPVKDSILNNMNKLKLGTIVLAKYSVDGEWYKAKIIEIAKEGASVQYIDYGNKEKLPFEYLVVNEKLSKDINNDSKPDLNSGNPYFNSINKGNNIPDHLRLKASDTDKMVRKSPEMFFIFGL